MASKERKKPRILVADDNEQNLELIEAYLTTANYEVIKAHDGEEALKKAKENFNIDLVVLDVMMPKIDGYEVCRRLKSNDESRLTPIIMLTALKDLRDKVKGFEVGADDFLNKPFNNIELLSRARSLIRSKRLNENLERAKDVIFTLSLAVEAHDPYLRGHSQRVGEYCVQLAEYLGLEKDFLNTLKSAAILHDLGKIGVRQVVLQKAGPLTDEEYAEIKQHPLIAEKICEPLKFASINLPIIRHHHERFDGKGYPDGLIGEEIPLGARIMAVADSFDAMVSDRAYRKAMPQQKAIAILKEAAGKQWEASLVKAFVELIKKQRHKKGLTLVKDEYEAFDLAALSRKKQSS